jgi:hypothetical protein
MSISECPQPGLVLGRTLAPFLVSVKPPVELMAVEYQAAAKPNWRDGDALPEGAN